MKHRVCECAETRRNLEREGNKPGGVKIGFCKFITVSLFCMLTSPLWADEGYLSCMDQTCCSGYSGVYWDTSGAGACSSCNGSGVTSFGYCTEGTRTICNSNYPKAAEFASSPNHCYRNIACAGENDAVPDENNNNARLYENGCIEYGNDDSHCFQAISSNIQNWTSDYHMEGTGDNAKCYSNTRACNLFTSETSPVDNVSGGPATWVRANASDPGHWNVSICRKTEPFNNSNPITIFNNEHPNCTGVKVSQPTGNNTSVNSATAQITYTGVGYFCTKCDPGYSITNPLSSNSNLQLFNNQGSNYVSSNYCTINNSNSAWPAANNQPFYVCKCIEVANGYYTDQQQTICNFTNNDADCHLNVDELTSFDNFVKKCPAGKTGPNGAIDQAQCYYGNYYSPASQNNSTQFCDAFGCVWLDGLSFNSTNQTYYWTGDVHLVGVSNNENADYLCPVYPDPPHFWGYDKDGNPIDTDGDIVNCGN